MMGEFFPDDILVAWGADGTGDLAVVRRDGSLAWWRHDAHATVRRKLVAVEVDWDVSACIQYGAGGTARERRLIPAEPA